MNTIELYTGDEVTINMTLVDADGAAVNLTGASCTYIASLSADAVSASFSVACDIAVPETGGLCSAALTDTETADPGRYFAELRIVWDAGPTLTRGRHILLIRKSLPVGGE